MTSLIALAPIAAFFFCSHNALAATFSCKLSSGTANVTGNVNTVDSNSYVAYPDPNSGLIVICATLADNNGNLLNAIACGIMTAQGSASVPNFRLNEQGKVTSNRVVSWESIGYTSDVSPFTGTQFDYRTGVATIGLSAACNRI